MNECRPAATGLIMVNVGIVGLGFMGMVHYLAYQRLPGVRVAAICDPKPRRLAGDWTDIRGNFGPPGRQMDLSGVATFVDYDSMLESTSLDLVDITLPPSLHVAATIRALQSGAHVLCEKPMALRLEDCERMADAAMKSGRQLYIGHTLPFVAEYAWAREVVAGARYGRLLGGAFHRVIADPPWLPNYWKQDIVGGPLMDLHVHDAHFIRLLFGMPDSVEARGRTRDGVPEYWHASMGFAQHKYIVHVTAGVSPHAGREFSHGFEIHLERATLAFNFAVIGGEAKYLCPPMLLDDEGQIEHPQLGNDPLDAFEAELRHVTCLARADEASDILDWKLAADAVHLCTLQSDALVALDRRPTF